MQPDFRTPKSRALHDFSMGYIRGKSFNDHCWHMGYQSRDHGHTVKPWREAFEQLPASPPADYLSAIHLLMEDCSKSSRDFSWMKETGLTGYSFLMNIYTVAHSRSDEKISLPDEKIASSLLDIFSPKDENLGSWKKLPQFKESLAEVVAIVTQRDKITFLQNAAETGNNTSFQRALELYQDPDVLKTHLSNISKGSFTILQSAAKAGKKKIIENLCGLCREHCDKETIQMLLKTSTANNFNLMHDMLVRDTADKNTQHYYGKETVTNVLRLYVFAFGEEARKLMHVHLGQRADRAGRKPDVVDWNMDRLMDNAIAGEQRMAAMPVSIPEIIAVISDSNKMTFSPGVTGNDMSLERATELHQDVVFLKAHLVHVNSEGYTVLQRAANVEIGSKRIIESICELCRKHLDKDALQTLLQAKTNKNLNLLHDMLQKDSKDPSAHYYGTDTVTNVLQLYVFAFGEEEARSLMFTQLKQKADGEKPFVGSWNMDSLMSNAIAREREIVVAPVPETPAEAHASGMKLTRMDAFKARMEETKKKQAQRGGSASKDS